MYNKDLDLLSRNLGLDDKKEQDNYEKAKENYNVQDTTRASHPMQYEHMHMMPFAEEMQARPRQMPYMGDGKTSAINIQYTAADGTMYQMSVMTPDKNKSHVLNNVFAELYGLIMSEGGQGTQKYEK